MTLKLIGAALIIIGCGAFGFSMAAGHKKEEFCLQQLIRVIEWMLCELEYRLTPLPELCRMAGQEAKGVVAEVFRKLSQELERQEASDASVCMKHVLQQISGIPSRTAYNLSVLGQSMGRFALSGQATGMRSVIVLCQRDLSGLAVDREARLRGYRTLGICGGVALAILFL